MECQGLVVKFFIYYCRRINKDLVVILGLMLAFLSTANLAATYPVSTSTSTSSSTSPISNISQSSSSQTNPSQANIPVTALTNSYCINEFKTHNDDIFDSKAIFFSKKGGERASSYGELWVGDYEKLRDDLIWSGQADNTSALINSKSLDNMVSQLREIPWSTNWQYDVLVVFRTKHGEWGPYLDYLNEKDGTNYNMVIDIYAKDEKGYTANNAYGVEPVGLGAKAGTAINGYTHIGSEFYYMAPKNWTMTITSAAQEQTDCNYGDDPSHYISENPPRAIPFDFEVCDYFPEAVQSWKENTYFEVSTYSNITGWSGEYKQRGNLTEDGLKIGYDPTGDGDLFYAHSSDVNRTFCDGVRCQPGGEKLMADVPIPNPKYNDEIDLEIASWGGLEQMCDGTYCTFEKNDDPDEFSVVTIFKSIRSLRFEGWTKTEKYHIIFQPDEDDSVYGLKIKNLYISGEAEAIMVTFDGDADPGRGRFTFDTAYFNRGLSFINKRAEVIVTNSFTIDSPLVIGNESSVELYIYGPEADVTFEGEGQDLYTRIVADEFLMYKGTIHGRVTANKLILGAENSHILGNVGSCGPIPIGDVELTMTPIKQLGLTCGLDDNPMRFEINTHIAGEPYSTGVDIVIEDEDKFDVTVADAIGSGSGTYPHFLSSADGYLALEVRPKAGVDVDMDKEYSITANLVATTSLRAIKATSFFKFVPFKFSLATEDKNLLFTTAGYPTDASLEVLGCSADSPDVKVIEQYSGTPDVSILGYVTPKEHEVDFDNSILTYAPTFVDGKSTEDSSELIYSNSGRIVIEVTDEEVNCEGFENCPMENSVNLSGSFEVLARPWTFAICQKDGSELPTGSDRYAYTDEKFDLLLKPLVWQPSYPEKPWDDVIDVSPSKGYCSGVLTTNYFKNTAQNTKVNLSSSQLLYPTGGVLGTGINGQVASTYFTGKGLLLEDLSWDEAGDVVLISSSTGYRNEVNQSRTTLGRFYPYQFKIKDNNKWDYNSTNFAYMNEPFDFDFEVEAQGMNGSATQNYGLFDDRNSISLIARLKNPNTLQNNGDDLASRIQANNATLDWGSDPNDIGGQNDSAVLFGQGQLVFIKRQVSASPYTTITDGPYDVTNIAVGLSSTTDNGVQFRPQNSMEEISTGNGDVAQTFAIQPDIRYGRMRLTDVSGAAGIEIMVPLAIDYWSHDDEFVTSDNDDKSGFIANEFCLIPSSSTIKLKNALGSGQDYVLNGQSTNLVVYQDEPKEERARVFLRQGSSVLSGGTCSWANYNQPWLQYNWRNLGDEDPSATVNFGQIRGNVRTIYRGEPQHPNESS